MARPAESYRGARRNAANGTDWRRQNHYAARRQTKRGKRIQIVHQSYVETSKGKPA